MNSQYYDDSDDEYEEGVELKVDDARGHVLKWVKYLHSEEKAC